MEKWAKYRIDYLEKKIYRHLQSQNYIVKYVFFTWFVKVKKFNITLWKEAYSYITGSSVNWYNLFKGSLAILKLEIYMLFDQAILVPLPICGPEQRGKKMYVQGSSLRIICQRKNVEQPFTSIRN